MFIEEQDNLYDLASQLYEELDDKRKTKLNHPLIYQSKENL